MKKTTALFAACLTALALLAGCGTAGGAAASRASAPAGASGTSQAAMSLAEMQTVYHNASAIVAGLNQLVTDRVNANNLQLKLDKPAGYTADEAYLGDVSIALLQSAVFTLSSKVVEGEGDEMQAAVAGAFEEAGFRDVAAVQGDERNSFVVTYTGGYTSEATGEAADAGYTMTVTLSPAGALRVVVLAETGGTSVQTALFEFVPLSGGRYAFQTATERALVTYTGQELSAFTYAQGAYSSANPLFSHDGDGIFPQGKPVGDGWVLDKSGYLQVLSYSGGTLDVEISELQPGGPRRAVIAAGDDAPAA